MTTPARRHKVAIRFGGWPRLLLVSVVMVFTTKPASSGSWVQLTEAVMREAWYGDVRSFVEWTPAAGASVLLAGCADQVVDTGGSCGYSDGAADECCTKRAVPLPGVYKSNLLQDCTDTPNGEAQHAHDELTGAGWPATLDSYPGASHACEIGSPAVAWAWWVENR